MSITRIHNIFKENRPNTPISKDIMQFLMNIMLSENTDMHAVITKEDVTKKTELHVKYSEIFDSFLGQVFLKRLHSLTKHKITLGMLIILLDAMKSPGACVMYIFYIQSRLSEPTTIDCTVFSTELFPWGLFSEAQLKTIWNVQKIIDDKEIENWHCHGAHDNLLDYDEIWKN